MVILKFAELNIGVECEQERLCEIYFKQYLSEEHNYDVCLNIYKSTIELERQLDAEARNCDNDNVVLITAILRQIGEKIPDYDGAVLHSASFAVDGVGVAFGALSGTGKSTHMFKWQDMLGGRFQIVNGDKPFIRFIDNELYIYGNPWAGKEGLQSNIKVPLKHICQIVRSETNHTEQMSKQEGINLLLNQIYMPFDPMARIKTIQLINRIADSVTFWKISCNLDDNAAETSYNAIFG